jgi:hypothetical protein
LSKVATAVQPFFVGDFVEALANLAFGVLFEQLHFLRIFQELLGQLGDAFRVGGREEQGLAFGRAALGDVGDVVVEAHVEHAVGFVEDQRVQFVELEVPRSCDP